MLYTYMVFVYNYLNTPSIIYIIVVYLYINTIILQLIYLNVNYNNSHRFDSAS